MTRSYLGFGLRIESDLALPGFVEGEGEAEMPLVRIEQCAVPRDRWHELNDDGGSLLGWAEGLMRFYVHGGDRMVIEPAPGADMDYVRAIVSGELMSALLRQRGLLVLHASCVAREGEAVGFVGHSGWGKSTLASHFVQRGYRLLSDDVLAVHFDGGNAMAVPGYPQVKLRADSGRRFVEDFEELPGAHSETDKRLMKVTDRFQDEPVPLTHLYVLEPQSRPVSEVVPLPPQVAFLELTRHTRASNLVKSPEFVEAHLGQVKSLLDTVPIRLLRRKRSLELLPELYELVEADRSEEARLRGPVSEIGLGESRPTASPVTENE